MLKKILKEKKELIRQGLTFIVVGTINTALDFGVLNLLMWMCQRTSGWHYVVFKGASFVIASTNSFFMNKRFTFRYKSEEKQGSKLYSSFFIITITGLCINVAIASSINNFIPAPFNLSPMLWANISAVFATGVSLFWNFLGYKFITFKKQPANN